MDIFSEIRYTYKQGLEEIENAFETIANPLVDLRKAMGQFSHSFILRYFL